MGKRLHFSFISGKPFEEIICTPSTHPTPQKSHKMNSVLDIISILRSLVLDFVAICC